MKGLDYKLALQLKEAGFPHDWCGFEEYECHYPTLPELIEAVGNDFAGVVPIRDHTEQIVSWVAEAESMISDKDFCIHLECCPDAPVGDTLEEAVAKLWLALNPTVATHHGSSLALNEKRTLEEELIEIATMDVSDGYPSDEGHTIALNEKKDD